MGTRAWQANVELLVHLQFQKLCRPLSCRLAVVARQRFKGELAEAVPGTDGKTLGREAAACLPGA
jgi:hypothetical protein